MQVTVRPITDIHPYEKRYQWEGNVLNALRADHPNALVVHWMGRPKPWEIAA